MATTARHETLSLKNGRDRFVALAAAAIQDHLSRSLLLGNHPPQVNQSGSGSQVKLRKEIRPVVDTGRVKQKKPEKLIGEEKEYVLDSKPLPLTLAQKMGLVEAPQQQLFTELEWQSVKNLSNLRHDSQQPCAICKENFGVKKQVLLSCSHVFHKVCLQGFERCIGRKTCPMCRQEHYQTRIIHDGVRLHKIKCAIVIQATWRGYLVRSRYRKMRETNPPKDPILKNKFYKDKLKTITDQIVQSCEINTDDFLADIERNLVASRKIGQKFHTLLDQSMAWEKIEKTVAERGQADCPICLTPVNFPMLLMSSSDRQDSPTGFQENLQKQKSSVLLSCSHIFHKNCLETLEEFFSGTGQRAVCPVCRSTYKKKILP